MNEETNGAAPTRPRTGEQVIVNAISQSPSGETTIKLPRHWEKLIPWLIAAFFGGDRLFADYVDAPEKIRDLKGEIQEFKKEVNDRLDSIEDAITAPASRPAIKGFRPHYE